MNKIFGIKWKAETKNKNDSNQLNSFIIKLNLLNLNI